MAETLKVFEAFSGIGAQHMALRNIGLNYEIVGTSDWDINATLSYNEIHSKSKIDFAEGIDIEDIEQYLLSISVSSDGKKPLTEKQIERYSDEKKRTIYNAFKNVNNLGSIVGLNPEDVPDCDLFTYSFPCTSVSLAGKQDGLEKGSGTSSSLLWECQKIIEAKKPKYLMMENVKNLVGKKFKSFFDEWVTYLDEQGYNTYWKVMNAKDYGIPQNRERVFAISVLKDSDIGYDFPKEFPLKNRLKDLLETSVDEKFYISQDKVDKLLAKMLKPESLLCDQSMSGLDGKIRGYNEYSPSITAREYKDPRLIRVGNVNPSGNGMNGEVYYEDGLAPTVTTNKGEGSKILKHESEYKVLGGIYTNDSPEFNRGVMKDLSRTLKANKHDASVVFTNQKVLQVGNIVDTGSWDNPQRGRIYSPDGVSPSLNTVGGGGLEPKILIKNATKQGYLEAVDGDGVDLTYPDSETRRGRVRKQISHTITTQDSLGVYNDFRIRKLTPKECWRLMGFTDEDFFKAETIQSNSTLYSKLATPLS